MITSINKEIYSFESTFTFIISWRPPVCDVSIRVIRYFRLGSREIKKVVYFLFSYNQ